MSGRKIRVKARAVPDSEKFGTANSGTKQVGFRVEVMDGELQGQSFTWYGYFTEAAGQRAIDSLKIAGWKDDDDGWRAFSQKKLPGLGTTTFELQLEEEDDQDDHGNPAGSYWKAAFINRIGVAMRDEMSDDEAVDFGRKMRAMYGGGAPHQQRGGQRPAQRPAQQHRPQQAAAQAQPPEFTDPPDDAYDPGF